MEEDEDYTSVKSKKTLELDENVQDQIGDSKIQSFIKSETNMGLNETDQQIKEEIFEETNQSNSKIVDLVESKPEIVSQQLEEVEEEKVDEKEMEKAALIIQGQRKKTVFKRMVQFKPIEAEEEVIMTKIKNGHFKV